MPKPLKRCQGLSKEGDSAEDVLGVDRRRDPLSEREKGLDVRPQTVLREEVGELTPLCVDVLARGV